MGSDEYYLYIPIFAFLLIGIPVFFNAAWFIVCDTFLESMSGEIPEWGISINKSSTARFRRVLYIAIAVVPVVIFGLPYIFAFFTGLFLNFPLTIFLAALLIPAFMAGFFLSKRHSYKKLHAPGSKDYISLVSAFDSLRLTNEDFDAKIKSCQAFIITRKYIIFGIANAGIPNESIYTAYIGNYFQSLEDPVYYSACGLQDISTFNDFRGKKLRLLSSYICVKYNIVKYQKIDITEVYETGNYKVSIYSDGTGSAYKEHGTICQGMMIIRK